ncbi:MAG: TolC family protein, partial [Flavobacteriales bacterium]|nr:TolC family protein [Flavobacteriales bacterium]
MRTIHTIIILLATMALHAQGPVSLGLQQALEMAAKQSYAVQASALEAEKAEAKIKEVTGIGLPQISATGTLQNYLEVPTMVIPDFFGGPGLIEMQFGVPWSASGAIQLQQLIFDGSYLVGLQAAREMRTKSAKDLEQAVLNAKVQAEKAYLGVLAAEEGVRLLGESVPVLEKARDEAAAMFAQGMIEATDADRLTVQLEEARNQQRNLQQQARVARAYLNLVLGLPTGTPVTLTDALQPLLDDAAETLPAGQAGALAEVPFDVTRHVDHQAAQSVMRLGELDVRNKKAAYLPSLGGFINYQQQFNYTSFDIGNGQWWFPASMWGLQLNVPIFSSGMRHQQVKQARLSLEQAEVNLKATEQRLLAEKEQQQAILRAAQDSYETGRRNLELSQRIFDRTSIKFTEGVAS